MSVNTETRTGEILVSGAGIDAAEPAITTGNDGKVFVAYVEYGRDKTGDLFVAGFDGELKSTGEAVRVNRNPGEVKTWYGDPPTIAAAADGTVYVGWTRRVRAAGGGGTDLVLSVSRDGGQTFAEPVKVNDDTAPASHGMHSLAVDGDRVYMSWLDERNVKADKAEMWETTPSPTEGFEFVKAHHTAKHNVSSDEAAEPNSEVFFASSTDGGKTFSKNVRVASDVCPCCKTATLAAGGKLYLSWRQVLPGSFRHIAVASSVDDGKTFSTAAIVSDDKWMLSACPVSGAALTTNDAGELIVYWYTAGAAGEPGLYRASSSDGGRTFAPRSLVDAPAVSGAPVLIKNKKGAACVLAENGPQISVIPAIGSETAAPRKIRNAELPAAAALGDGMVIAFVRKEGNARSVWVTR
ncbi:MAG: sialidase family protein [Acidobacteriota bacterium]